MTLREKKKKITQTYLRNLKSSERQRTERKKKVVLLMDFGITSATLSIKRPFLTSEF